VDIEAIKTLIESLKVQIESSHTRTETVRTDIQSVRAEFSKETEKLTQQVGDKQVSSIRWTVGTGLAAVAAVAAIIKLIP